MAGIIWELSALVSASSPRRATPDPVAAAIAVTVLHFWRHCVLSFRMNFRNSSLLTPARRVWRSMAPPGLRKAAHPVAIWIREHRVYSQLAAGEPQPRQGPLIVSGLLSGAKGISEGARLTIAGLRHAGLDPIEHSLDFAALHTWDEHLQAAMAPSGGVWLLHLNPPELIYALSSMPAAAWLGRYRIGYWAYELERVPDIWVRAARTLHEIWAPSSFVANALKRSGITTNVRIMPHPVALSASSTTSNRSAFGLPDDAFVVLALGDLASSAARKNLLGAITAYIHAFDRPASTRLVVKVRQIDASPGFLLRARQAARGRSDISFIVDDLTTAETQALIASSDVLLSLHRAEGFGLTLAEAFMAGVPALATGWSGNLDFMESVPELLVDFEMTRVRDLSGVYRSTDQSWAEPDIESAAQKLRMLEGNPDLRKQLAAKGKAAVERLTASWSGTAIGDAPLGRYSARPAMKSRA